MTIGQIFEPTSSSNCTSGTYFQRYLASGNSYVIQAGGRITAWSQWAGTGSGQVRLVVLTLGPGGGRVAVAKSAYQPITPGALNTFPTNLEVDAGDAIAFEISGGFQCPTAFFNDFSTYGSYSGSTDIGVERFYFESSEGYRINVSAVLEPTPYTPGSGGGDPPPLRCPPGYTPYENSQGRGCSDDRAEVDFFDGRLRGQVRLRRNGTFSLPRLKIDCPAGPVCKVSTSVTATFPQSARKVRLGGSKFSLKGGRSKRVSAKIGKKGRALLKRRLKIKAKMRVVVKRNSKDTREFAKGDSRSVNLVLRPYRR